MAAPPPPSRPLVGQVARARRRGKGQHVLPQNCPATTWVAWRFDTKLAESSIRCHRRRRSFSTAMKPRARRLCDESARLVACAGGATAGRCVPCTDHCLPVSHNGNQPGNCSPSRQPVCCVWRLPLLLLLSPHPPTGTPLCTSRPLQLMALASDKAAGAAA